MRETPVTRNYAEALFELGGRHGEQEAFAAAFDTLADALQDRQLRFFLQTPKVDPGEKKKVLAHALQGRVPELFLRFVLVVIDKRRQNELRDIAREYHALIEEQLGRLHVQVTLARQPAPGQQQEIAAELSRTLGKIVVPHVRVDPEILGGIVVRYGDRVLDGSLKRKLSSLRHRLLEVEVPRTQSAQP